MEPSMNFEKEREAPREAFTVQVAKLLSVQPKSFSQFTPAEFLALPKEAQSDAVVTVLDSILFDLHDTEGPVLTEKLRSELQEKLLKLTKAAVDAGILSHKDAQIYI